MKGWLLLGVIVGSTVTADLLQSLEMKRHGEIRDFRPSRLGRLLATLARKTPLILAIAFMAVSFFAFMALVQVADLSFAVPASAASLVFETILARVVLKERVDSRRWVGLAWWPAAFGFWRCDPGRHCPGGGRLSGGCDIRLPNEKKSEVRSQESESCIGSEAFAWPHEDSEWQGRRADRSGRRRTLSNPGGKRCRHSGRA